MQYGAQNSVLQNVENYNNRTTRRYVLGAEGVFNLFDIDWTFKSYFQHGEVDFHNTLENILITPYYNAAIDAVQVTTTNQSSDLAFASSQHRVALLQFGETFPFVARHPVAVQSLADRIQ